jgi:hypothetical protein
MTPERKAEVDAEAERILEEVLGPLPMPKPNVVTRDDLGTVRDADVHVSRADPNADGTDKVVPVRRPDWVAINYAAYEAQRADKAAWRRYIRGLDPYRLNLYGSEEEE